MDCKVPSKTQSNEEVIEELTKDLEKSCIQEENLSDEEKYFDVCKKSDKTKDDDDSSSKHNETEEIIVDEAVDEYFVDDVALKDRDLNLTDEQKKEFKTESENLKNKGNNLFKDADYINATSTYTKALRICPLIFEKTELFFMLIEQQPKPNLCLKKISAIEDCTKAIELDSNYVKAYLRRAHFYEETDKLDEALADYKKVLTFDPMHTESMCAIKKLEPIINERNEKLKEEMLGKLKDLGNMILRPFGLSTNNFQMQKDETSGGYSVKFNQNPT